MLETVLSNELYNNISVNYAGFMNPQAGKELSIGCPETSVRN